MTIGSQAVVSASPQAIASTHSKNIGLVAKHFLTTLILAPRIALHAGSALHAIALSSMAQSTGAPVVPVVLVVPVLVLVPVPSVVVPVVPSVVVVVPSVVVVVVVPSLVAESLVTVVLVDTVTLVVVVGSELALAVPVPVPSVAVAVSVADPVVDTPVVLPVFEVSPLALSVSLPASDLPHAVRERIHAVKIKLRMLANIPERGRE
jgi:hypothetical protein